ncbi:MAG: hypothetical protein O3A92_09575 [Verrucomicrobia bacterium]|nr:hypothetical protein [Verrucomicrobiota bacterium]
MKATLTTLLLGTLVLISPAALAGKGSSKKGSDTSDTGKITPVTPGINDLRPTGTLSITKRLVRTGTHPQIDWEINYPLNLTSIVDIGPDDSLETLTETQMKIRVAGASYQPYGYDAVVALQTRISSLSSSWLTLFQGTNGQVDTNRYIFNGVVPSNTSIDFSVRGQLSRSWTPSRDTLSENQNITVLRNGDDVPQYTPAFNQGSIESHVSSFVQNGKIVLGPRDLIYLVEVGQTNILSSGFDMQDMVFIVTFDDVQTTR